MSRDVKYIGMDVHKEATVIAVRNTSGDLVMESIVATESSDPAICPRSAWRATCDLGRRDLGGLAVRPAEAPRARSPGLQPRRNALMKEGSLCTAQRKLPSFTARRSRNQTLS
jgi:hypothetical protein